MSTSWDVHCRTCSADLGLDVDNAEAAMRELVQLAPELARLAAFQLDIADWRIDGPAVRVLDRPVDLSWFARHAGHDLAPQNEYGQFSDRCGALVKCTSCGVDHWCVLAAQHEGAHAHG